MARRADRDGTAPGGLTFDGDRKVTVEAVHRVPEHRVDHLRALGVPTPTFYELSEQDAGTFAEQIESLKDNNPYSASVYVYPVEEYRQMRLFLTEDGKAGFALHGDDIVSAFSRRDSPHSGCVRAILATAIDQGGRRCDCFDTVLPKLYATEGMVPVARLGWNDDYAPDGWDKNTYRQFNEGEPDVVFMAYRPEAISGSYSPGAGSRIGDYDAGTAEQRRSLSTITGVGLDRRRRRSGQAVEAARERLAAARRRYNATDEGIAETMRRLESAPDKSAQRGRGRDYVTAEKDAAIELAERDSRWGRSKNDGPLVGLRAGSDRVPPGVTGSARLIGDGHHARVTLFRRAAGKTSRTSFTVPVDNPGKLTITSACQEARSNSRLRQWLAAYSED